MKALYIASTGMSAQERNVEVISNNIANMNTVGFKRQRAEFQDLLYQNVERMGAQSSSQGTVVPTGIQIGAGVKAGSVYRVVEQGTPTHSGNRFDLRWGCIEAKFARQQLGPLPEGLLEDLRVADRLDADVGAVAVGQRLHGHQHHADVGRDPGRRGDLQRRDEQQQRGQAEHEHLDQEDLAGEGHPHQDLRERHPRTVPDQAGRCHAEALIRCTCSSRRRPSGSSTTAVSPTVDPCRASPTGDVTETAIEPSGSSAGASTVSV